MLLSMLEGNVVNGAIGRQMVDTLVESSANFEVITCDDLVYNCVAIILHIL